MDKVYNWKLREETGMANKYMKYYSTIVHTQCLPGK